MTGLTRVRLALGCCVSMLCASLTFAQTTFAPGITDPDYSGPRPVPSNMIEIKLGGYKPKIDSDPSLNGHTPYADTFGGGSMLLFELEVERELWHRFGSLGIGVSVGYSEKYGSAQYDSSGGGALSGPSGDKTSLKVIPLKAMAVYRFDYPALHWGFPVVPYVKGGFTVEPWWVTKGSGVEYSGGARAAGFKGGYGGVFGLALMLDYAEAALGRDFRSDYGVFHSYLFAEFNDWQVQSFRNTGLNLSGQYFMFGFAFEF